MRITGGALGGRTLVIPKNDKTRPSSDRLRETLFNILINGMGIKFKNCVDLFAGSGSLGLEAISHGANKAVFVESDKKALDAIKKNISTLSLDSQTQIITNPKIEKWPELLSSTIENVDIAFADPPYEKGLAKKAFEQLCKTDGKLFAPEAVFVLEIGAKEYAPEPVDGWRLVKERAAGAGKVCIYSHLC